MPHDSLRDPNRLGDDEPYLRMLARVQLRRAYQAVRMHYLEGMKLSEVAEQLGKTSGAVAGLLHRGIKTLRQRLGDA